MVTDGEIDVLRGQLQAIELLIEGLLGETMGRYSDPAERLSGAERTLLGSFQNMQMPTGARADREREAMATTVRRVFANIRGRFES